MPSRKLEGYEAEWYNMMAVLINLTPYVPEHMYNDHMRAWKFLLDEQQRLASEGRIQLADDSDK